MNTRSFFLTLSLAVMVLVTGCAGSGGIQARANIPITSNGHVGSIQVGGQGSNSIYAPQQQSQQQQPQVVINNNNYQQTQHQPQGSVVGSTHCPCVVTQWGKACGNAAQSHQHNNPHMRLQCTR
jgi:hypothetical protein